MMKQNKTRRISRTLIMDKIIDGDDNDLSLLIAKSRNINAVDVNNETALFHAIRKWDYSISKKLIENGADVNHIDKNGNTPLFRAIFESQGRDDLIELLINAGGDPTIKNKYGVSPFDLANTISNSDMKNIIMLLGRAPNNDKIGL